MLALRLARIGCKHDLKFRIIAQEKTKSPKSGKFIEILGSHNPTKDQLEYKKERLEYYLQHGAQPSNTLARLLQKKGLPNLTKFIQKYSHKKAKKEKNQKKSPEASTPKKIEKENSTKDPQT